MPPKIVHHRSDLPQHATNMHVRLHQVSVAPTATAAQVMQQYRQVAIDETGAIGAFHIQAVRGEEWSLQEKNTTGRVPLTAEIKQQLLATSQAAAERNRTQIQPISQPDKFFVVCAPVNTQRQPVTVIGVVVSANTGFLQATAFQLETVASYNGMWLQKQWSDDNDWQLQVTAALCELTTRTLSQSNLGHAGIYLVNELRTLTGAHLVAIALVKRRHAKLIAISGKAVVDHHSKQARLLRDLLNMTAFDKQDRLSLRNADPDLQHHHAFQNFDLEAVRSLPLLSPEGDVVASLFLGGKQSSLASDRTDRVLKAAGPHLALALQAVQEKQPSRLHRFLRAGIGLVTKFSGWAISIALCCLIALLFLPTHYSVACRVQVVPQQRRYIVAPVNGMLQQCYVKPGQEVSTSTLLAKFDGRELRWELAALVADRLKAGKQRDIELSEAIVAKAVLAGLEEEQLQIKETLLRHQLDQLEIHSPIDGMVLSASFEQDQNLPLDKGSVLFEIVPLHHNSIKVAVPAEEVATIREGNEVSIWMNGLGSRVIRGEIASIAPQSESFEERNVFMAEVELFTAISDLRPGMQGRARVQGEKHALGWNLFHKPWEWCQAFLGW